MDYFKGMLLYEDSNYFVLNKDYGVSAQGGKDRDKNLPNLMSNYLIESGQTQSVFRVVHRLDRPVSGLMFAAKSSNAAREFSYLLEKRLNLVFIYINSEKDKIIHMCSLWGSSREIGNYQGTTHIQHE